MSSRTVHLNTDELWTALDDVDPVGVLLDELVTGAVTDPGSRRSIRLASADCDTPPAIGRAEDLAVLEDQDTGARCLLPAAVLRDVRTAALVALAARHLVASRVVTAAVLGWSDAAALRLAAILRSVPDTTHVAVCAPGGTKICARIRDQLDLAGIGLSVTEHASDAVRGANLVHLLDPDLGRHRLGPLAKGAVVVNGSGRVMADDVTADVDQIYVDHAALLPDTAGRYVLPARPGPDVGVASTRRPGDPNRPQRIEADLVQVVTGTHPGRIRPDDVLLVELLSANVLNVELADQLCHAATRGGI